MNNILRGYLGSLTRIQLRDDGTYPQENRSVLLVVRLASPTTAIYVFVASDISYTPEAFRFCCSPAPLAIRAGLKLKPNVFTLSFRPR